MNECCLTNLGCLQIPVSTIGSAGQVGPVGPAGAAGATGATGANGANGSDGTTRLYSLTASTTTATTGSYANLATYTLPANTLDTDGSGLIIRARTTQDAVVVGFNIPFRRITFDGNSCTTIGSLEPIALDQTLASGERIRLDVEFIRASSSTAICRVIADAENGVNRNDNIYEVSLTGLNFTQNNVINLDTFQQVANETNLRTLTIDLIKQ